MHEVGESSKEQSYQHFLCIVQVGSSLQTVTWIIFLSKYPQWDDYKYVDIGYIA